MGKKIDSKIEEVFSKMFKKKHEKIGNTQSHIPVEYIKDNIIKMKQGREYRIIISVDAVNFFIKTDEEKFAIINQFGIFLDSAKTRMQIVSQSKTLDLKETLSELKAKYTKCDNPHTKEYIAIYANLLNNLSEDSNVLTKDFYLVLKYTAKENETFLNVSKNFNYLSSRMIKSLEGCGIKSNILDTGEIYQLLYLFYNKDKSKLQNVNNQNFHSYLSPALMVKQKQQEADFEFMKPNGAKLPLGPHLNQVDTSITPDIQTIQNGMVSVEDIIAADDIVMEKDHLVINSRYIRTIFISGILKEECFPEWMSDLYSYPANIDISIHINPIAKKDALDQLEKQYTFQLANMYERQNKGKTIDERERNDAMELDYLKKIISSNQEMYQMSFYVSISANALEELDEITMNIEAMLGNKQILTRRASLNQLTAFNSVLPVGKDDIAYYRNIPTEALSTFFPFTNSELSCTKGKPILYGANLLTGSLIIFDKFNPPDSSITNYNSIICGAAGSGKSFGTKLEIMRRYIEGTKVIGIDPNSEYDGVVARCGGEYISIGAGRDKINIFDISYYEDENGRIPNLLQDKIVNLHSIFRTMFGMANEPYSAQYFNTIERALRDVYAYKGITQDPASLFINNKIMKGNANLGRNYFKEPPTLSDFKIILMRNYGEVGRHLIENVLDIFIDGSYNIFNGQSTIDMSSNMIFFDIKDCSEELKPLMYLVLCDFIWEKMKRKPKKETATFVVDEAWIMMRQEFTAKFLAEFARQCRKFNIGLACITQQAGDFFNDPWGYGKTIYANTSMHVLMKQTKDDIGIIAETYKISDSIKMDLITSQSGYGYIFWGNTFTKIYFIASQEEFEVINTNPNLV